MSGLTNVTGARSGVIGTVSGVLPPAPVTILTSAASFTGEDVIEFPSLNSEAYGAATYFYRLCWFVDLAGNGQGYMRMMDGSSEDTSSNYGYALTRQRWDTTTPVVTQSTATDKWLIGPEIATAGDGKWAGVCDIFMPVAIAGDSQGLAQPTIQGRFTLVENTGDKMDTGYFGGYFKGTTISGSPGIKFYTAAAAGFTGHGKIVLYQMKWTS